MDLDNLTIADIVALQTAEEHGHEVVYPAPGDILDQLGAALQKMERITAERDMFRNAHAEAQRRLAYLSDLSELAKKVPSGTQITITVNAAPDDYTVHQAEAYEWWRSQQL